MVDDLRKRNLTFEAVTSLRQPRPYESTYLPKLHVATTTRASIFPVCFLLSAYSRVDFLRLEPDILDQRRALPTRTHVLRAERFP